ncbi:MAG: hypothetical protein JSS99_05345 [Actinobacteria bacterium]|nr:hypothetical protein [Actinomycetota bacterium]
MLLLGPPLSHVLYPRPLPFTYLPNVIQHPEPVEGTRYVLSLSAPLLLVGGIALTARRPLPRRAGLVAAAAQMLGAALILACLIKQREAGWQLAFFARWQLVAGAGIAAALAIAARRGWLTRPLPRPPGLSLGVALLLALVTGAWFLSFVNTDQSIWWAGDPYNSGFMYDETYAVLNGMTPLADFTSAYGSVWPYPLALWLYAVGPSLLAFTLAMWALCIATVLAIFGALRRATRHALHAFGLTLPIMAFVFFGAVREVHRPLAIFQEMPLRNVGPFIVAWLLARRLERGGRSWPLFLVAGLGLWNNVEFGLAALAGALLALVMTTTPLDRRALQRILGGATLGMVAAYALLALVTLPRAGALPAPERALEFARIFGMGGFGLDRLPHLLGLPLVIYMTYAAALGVATVRSVGRAPNHVLTGLLAWSAIYGFGSGAYYMGESVPRGIPTTFPPWSFTLALLAAVAVQQMARAPRRRPSLAALAALFGFGVVASFVLDPPASVLPWRQVATIRHHPADPMLARVEEVATALVAPRDPAFRAFVGASPDGVVHHGAAIALLWSTGHVIADQYGFRNVVPYVGESTLTIEQLDETLARLRAAGGSVVLVPDLIMIRLAQPLADRGFHVLTRSGYRPAVAAFNGEPERVLHVHGLTKWVDGRALPHA